MKGAFPSSVPAGKKKNHKKKTKKTKVINSLALFSFAVGVL
jgi:hypothetical protein